MNDQEKQEVINQISKEISKTEKLIGEYKDFSQPIAPENSIGRISRMEAINNKSITEAALRNAEEKLVLLKNMLDRVNDPDFGLCAKCHAPIPIKRLLLMPHSRFCVACAS
jgi:DnaK suppressor protein